MLCWYKKELLESDVIRSNVQAVHKMVLRTASVLRDRLLQSHNRQCWNIGSVHIQGTCTRARTTGCVESKT